MVHGIRTRDGRRLTVEEYGDPDGSPVVLLHDAPGCRFGVVPPHVVTAHPHIRFIAYDRPGYGDSDRLPGRRVADAARDVAELAGALGLGRFSVLGLSGGAPHALACAALLPSRVRRAAVLASPAPPDARDLRWFDGMAASRVEECTRALTDPLDFAERLAARAAGIRRDPAQLLVALRDGLTESDRRILAVPAVAEMLLRTYREALRGSSYGWLDDGLALLSSWGFDPAAVTRPVLLWHGGQDTFSPVGHFTWLADRIPRARPVLRQDAGHFGALAALPDVLDWLCVPPASS
ncbi:pimeloyl-ACP methyl ester carboxylesterase [Streptomyces sp. SAI-133]|uniref:alpha/beta fold hydrolase n=1 Tax=unclassified Streptomyces TaxID=2593676 RepID=UPI0024760C1B|nr:alpha/beta fold hydrolase [Streptomyces sp. SAI-133]MDH6583611.1 pimeloyl-ACP methyl ester carboxylesterase [Streptomyces sp. SAI-133]